MQIQEAGFRARLFAQCKIWYFLSMDKQSLPPAFAHEASSQSERHRFKITFCEKCGFRQRAVKVAAELENALQETTVLVKSSNGIFEIEDRGLVIFSNKKTNRFPDTDEIVKIARALDSGQDLASIEKTLPAATKTEQSFEDWYIKAYGRPKPT